MRLLGASLFFALFLSVSLNAQDAEIVKTVDSLYKEDHYYISVTYNLLNKMPEDMAQNGFSYGFHLGYIKDMPINKRRNVALGIGLGYSVNSYNQNLLIEEDANGNFNYSLLMDKDTYSRNEFSNHIIELPIEFRWRTSTPTDYQFWRVYAGFKFGYMFFDTMRHKGDLGSFKFNGNDDFNRFQYGLTMSAGYNTWNIFLYYPLNTIFSEEATLEGQPIEMNTIRVGLIFYIL